MIKFLALFLLFAFGFLRYFQAKNAGRRANHLLISLFIQTIPLGYGKSLLDFLPANKGDNFQLVGEFGSIIWLEVSLIFFLALVFMGFYRVSFMKFVLKDNAIPISGLLIFTAVSILNPYNAFYPAAVVPIWIIFQLLLLLSLFKSNFTRDEVLHGFFDGFMWSSILQFVLCVFYPVLGVEAVATMFKGENAFIQANRREGYLSAIGTFQHPGNLALFALFCTLFFMSCYLNKYKVEAARLLIFINLIVIGLTFSRATYISAMAVMTLLFVVKKQKSGIFSVKNVAIFLVLFLCVLGVLYLTPLSDAFLKSDAEEQFENRFNHIALGFELWNYSRFWGIGINSHVYYMSHQFGYSLLEKLPIFSFLISNPIHNIHMIVLVESGLVGVLFWFYFFVSRVNNFSKRCHTASLFANVYNLSYLGVLVAFFIYGFLGWSPFMKEIYVVVICIGFFAEDVGKQKGKNNRLIDRFRIV